MNIQPTQFVQVPLGGTASGIDILVSSFPLFPAEIEIKWTVYGEGFSKTGSMILPESIVDQWGTDDSVVKNYVLQQLNLAELVVPEPDPAPDPEPDPAPEPEPPTENP